MGYTRGKYNQKAAIKHAAGRNKQNGELTAIVIDKLLQAAELCAWRDVEAAAVQLSDLVMLHIQPFGVVIVQYGQTVSTWKGYKGGKEWNINPFNLGWKQRDLCENIHEHFLAWADIMLTSVTRRHVCPYVNKKHDPFKIKATQLTCVHGAYTFSLCYNLRSTSRGTAKGPKWHAEVMWLTGDASLNKCQRTNDW